MTTKKELMNRLTKLEEMYATETDHRKKTAILNLIFEIATTLGILATWFFPKYGKKKMREIAWEAIFQYDEGEVPEERELLTIRQLELYPAKYTAYQTAIKALETANAMPESTDAEKTAKNTAVEAARKAIREARANPKYKKEDEGKKGKGKGKGNK